MDKTQTNKPNAAALCLASTLLLAAATTVQAGIIDVATVGSVPCTDTNEFASATDCVGVVTDPNNDVGNNPGSTNLLGFLNGVGGNSITDNGGTPWGGVANQGNWIGLAEFGVPGMSSDANAVFSATSDGAGDQSGDWTFTITQTDWLAAYLVVSVKGGPTWSAYFYDFSAGPVATFTAGWDTLGITTGGQNPRPGPGLSHISAYYLAGPDGNIPAAPVPGVPALLALGLAGLAASRHIRRARRR